MSLVSRSRLLPKLGSFLERFLCMFPDPALEGVGVVADAGGGPVI